MPKRKRSRGGVVFGFVVTVGVLSLITLVLLESGPGVTVVQIPNQLPAYPSSGFLQRYVPHDALQVSFDNLTAIRAINKSVISGQQFFELDQPHVSINATAIGWRLTVGLSIPNATVTIVTLDPSIFENLSATLTGAGAGSSIPTNKVGDVTVYAAAGTLSGETQAYWLTVLPLDHALLYSPGANEAFQAVARIVNVYRGSVPSILNRTDVDRMLYAVNGTQGHLALGIQNFAGSVTTGNATLIAIDTVPSYTVISYVVRFSDATVAAAQLGAVKSAYISAHDFSEYNELVKAVEFQPISQLKVGVGLVG